MILDFLGTLKSGTATIEALNGVFFRVIDAEGLDLTLCFFLAFISGRIIYSRTTDFDIGNFKKALLVWVGILTINEIIQYALPFREGAALDILYNMIGVTLGLLLSTGWFWRGGGCNMKYIDKLREIEKADE